MECSLITDCLLELGPSGFWHIVLCAIAVLAALFGLGSLIPGTTGFLLQSEWQSERRSHSNLHRSVVRAVLIVALGASAAVLLLPLHRPTLLWVPSPAAQSVSDCNAAIVQRRKAYDEINAGCVAMAMVDWLDRQYPTWSLRNQDGLSEQRLAAAAAAVLTTQERRPIRRTLLGRYSQSQADELTAAAVIAVAENKAVLQYRLLLPPGEQDALYRETVYRSADQSANRVVFGAHAQRVLTLIGKTHANCQRHTQNVEECPVSVASLHLLRVSGYHVADDLMVIRVQLLHPRGGAAVTPKSVGFRLCRKRPGQPDCVPLMWSSQEPPRQILSDTIVVTLEAPVASVGPLEQAFTLEAVTGGQVLEKLYPVDLGTAPAPCLFADDLGTIASSRARAGAVWAHAPADERLGAPGLARTLAAPLHSSADITSQLSDCDAARTAVLVRKDGSVIASAYDMRSALSNIAVRIDDPSQNAAKLVASEPAFYRAPGVMQLPPERLHSLWVGPYDAAPLVLVIDEPRFPTNDKAQLDLNQLRLLKAGADFRALPWGARILLDPNGSQSVVVGAVGSGLTAENAPATLLAAWGAVESLVEVARDDLSPGLQRDNNLPFSLASLQTIVGQNERWSRTALGVSLCLGLLLALLVGGPRGNSGGQDF